MQPRNDEKRLRLFSDRRVAGAVANRTKNAMPFDAFVLIATKLAEDFLDPFVDAELAIDQYWRPISPSMRTAPWRIIDQTVAMAFRSWSSSEGPFCRRSR